MRNIYKYLLNYQLNKLQLIKLLTNTTDTRLPTVLDRLNDRQSVPQCDPGASTAGILSLIFIINS